VTDVQNPYNAYIAEINIHPSLQRSHGSTTTLDLIINFKIYMQQDIYVHFVAMFRERQFQHLKTKKKWQWMFGEQLHQPTPNSSKNTHITNKINNFQVPEIR